MPPVTLHFHSGSSSVAFAVTNARRRALLRVYQSLRIAPNCHTLLMSACQREQEEEEEEEESDTENGPIAPFDRAKELTTVKVR